ncbi:RagB/SusD family nutrient uptake outer membrane protein [Niabella sp.]|uniref:RagB/SusD family nutrient uptake outer membrane protein n=1 Tax=Niabella sp. TaxID=1962976 RepID=UPI002603BFCA|nr:RagB/SusD family nutrient uptake outer membrane protein [Niabella sp.]
MRNKSIISCLSFSIIALMSASCRHDRLFDIPVTFKGYDVVFTDSARAEFFVNNMETEMPADHGNSYNRMQGGAMLASASDEAMHISTNKTVPSAPTRMSAGNWSPSNMRYYNSSDGAGEIGSWLKWGGYHGNRKANTALKYLDNLPPTVSTRFRNRLKGEATFVRAMQHWFLFQKWGGIPIVNVAYEASDDVIQPRNSVKSVVDFIVSECDRAITLFPDEPYSFASEIGRPDKGTAMALKSRTLLYAASPLYNGDGYNHSGDTLICYGSADPKRWELAAKAAQDVVDLGWYNLYVANDPTKRNGTRNYKELFFAWGVNYQNNKEFIYSRIRTTNRDTENDNFPSGFTNAKGGTCPSQDLVDAYEMADGTLFNWNDPVKKANPYVNRDPRFYASIIYNGAKYDKFASHNGSPTNQYNFDIYEGGKNKAGLSQTETGYYLMKFMDYENVNPVTGSGGTYHCWPYFRYAEILLNLAEAGNEAGGPGYVAPGAARPLTPVEAIDLIRARAGMPDIATSFAKRGIALTKENLRTQIRNERRIELAFEEHRYYDVRRWMIITDGYIRGVKTTKNSDQTFSYDPNIQAEKKVFDPKHYFYPIPQVEINRNYLLRQNPGW